MTLINDVTPASEYNIYKSWSSPKHHCNFPSPIMVVTSEERARLDPYSHIAESKDVSVLQKIAGYYFAV